MSGPSGSFVETVDLLQATPAAEGGAAPAPADGVPALSFAASQPVALTLTPVAGTVASVDDGGVPTLSIEEAAGVGTLGSGNIPTSMSVASREAAAAVLDGVPPPSFAASQPAALTVTAVAGAEVQADIGAQAASGGGASDLGDIGDLMHAPVLCGCMCCSASAALYDGASGDGQLFAAPNDDPDSGTAGNMAASTFTAAGNGTGGFDSLYGAFKWGTSTLGGGLNISYSFAVTSWDANSSLYTIGYSEPVVANGFSVISDSVKNAVRAALQVWANVANITFTEVGTETSSNVGAIRFGNSSFNNSTAKAISVAPSNAKAGDVWFNPGFVTDANVDPGERGFNTIIHEIGHALGLKHPHEGAVLLDASLDYRDYTVMSYKTYSGQGGQAVSQSFYSVTPMYLDVAAVQYLYGANANFNAGNTTYSWTPGANILQTIWDGGGTDTIDASNQLQKSVGETNGGINGVLINLNPNVWNEIGVSRDQSSVGGDATQTQTVMIAEGAVIENAIGTAFHDSITGNGVANTLTGGDGDDTMTGGAGNDSLNGGNGFDTAVFAGSRASYSIVRGAGTVTVTDLDAVTNGNDGADTLTSIQRLQFSDGALVLAVPKGDFSGDGMSDLLWTSAGGSLAQWQQSGTSYIGGGVFSGPPSEWTMAAFSDFQGDGKVDILWQHTTGALAEWHMDGINYIGGGVMSGPGGDWSLAAVADFNGDGKSDLLWQSASGALAQWYLDGTSYIGGGVFSGPGNGWVLKATADFTGDGKSDLLWQDGNTMAAWYMDGTTYIGGGVFTGAGAGWTLKAASDFSGDGKADLLWSDGANALAQWQMDGITYIGGGVFAGAGAGWSIAGVSDFDADGRSDLLWEHTGGSLALWEMNGTTVEGGGVFGVKPGGWTLASLGQLIA